MSSPPIQTANFGFLAQHNAQLARLGALAERYFGDDHHTALMKLRQFAELLAQLTAAKAGFLAKPDEPVIIDQGGRRRTPPTGGRWFSA